MQEEETPQSFVKATLNALFTFKVILDTKDDEKINSYSSIIAQNFSTLEEIIVKNQKTEHNFTPDGLIIAIADSDLIMVTLSVFLNLSVEQRKQFTRVFSGCVTYSLDHSDHISPIIQYIQKNEIVLDILLHFYDHQELAMCAGEMLRTCASSDELAQLLLQDKRLDLLFSYFTVSHFDISSDSFLTFKALLLMPPGAAAYLEQNFSEICSRLHSLLNENNYTTCISALQLIGQMIMNFENIQAPYLSCETNLMLMMNLMVSTYKTIAKESYHIFKLFVVFEPKTPNIQKLLVNNAEKLIPFLPSLIDDSDGEEMKQELDTVIDELRAILLQSK